MNGQPMGGGFGGGRGIGGGLTETGKRVAIALTALFAAELLLVHWLHVPFIGDLFLYPIGAPRFGIWQLVTHPFVQEPQAILPFAFQLLALYFFGAPVEAAVGRKGFLTLFFAVPLAAALPGLVLTSLFFADLPGAAYGGLEAASLALIAAFALLHRDANILLFFVLPIRAIWLLYGTAAYLAFTTLAKMDPHGFYYLLALGLSYLYIQGGGGGMRAVRLRYQEWKIKRKLSKLRVVPGGRRDDDGPMYH